MMWYPQSIIHTSIYYHHYGLSLLPPQSRPHFVVRTWCPHNHTTSLTLSLRWQRRRLLCGGRAIKAAAVIWEKADATTDSERWPIDRHSSRQPGDTTTKSRRRNTITHFECSCGLFGFISFFLAVLWWVARCQLLGGFRHTLITIHATE